MANTHNPSAVWQGASGPGRYDDGVAAGSGPGDDQDSGQEEQYIELPEHQGVIIDYIPPRGGSRSEAGHIDGEGEADDLQS